MILRVTNIKIINFSEILTTNDPRMFGLDIIVYSCAQHLKYVFTCSVSFCFINSLLPLSAAGCG